MHLTFFFFLSNLLMPVGVTRQSAVFTLKVYQAEDLPQSKNRLELFTPLSEFQRKD